MVYLEMKTEPCHELYLPAGTVGVRGESTAHTMFTFRSSVTGCDWPEPLNMALSFICEMGAHGSLSPRIE